MADGAIGSWAIPRVAPESNSDYDVIWPGGIVRRGEWPHEAAFGCMGQGCLMLDLHLHSTFSDGTCRPRGLVELARQRQLRLVAVTDHDTVAGTAEAMAAGRRFGVRVLSGLELSVYWQSYHFHLLAYDFNWQDRSLCRGLQELQDAREQRNKMIVQILAGCGIAIDYDEVRTISAVGQTGRPHIARLLVEKKVVGSIDQAFERYLRRGGSAYVPRFLYTVDQAIALIHGAGGVAVLAHPGQLTLPLDELEQLVGALKERGLDGIETFYPTQKGKQLRQLRALAHHFQLLETGGSDYHGDLRPGTGMAGGPHFSVPGEVFLGLQHRWNGAHHDMTRMDDQ